MEDFELIKQAKEILILFIKLIPNVHSESMVLYNELANNKSQEYIDKIFEYINTIPNFRILQKGSMGYVVEYNDHIIKIIDMDKTYPLREEIILREMTIIYELFFSDSKVPKSLNKIYGYCSENKLYSKNSIMSKINIKLDCGIDKKLDAFEKDNMFGFLPVGFTYNSILLNEDYVYYFMEKSGCDMFGYYYDNISMSDEETKLSFIKKYLTDVSEAVSYLHSKNFIHNDIKQENILVDVNDDDNFRFQLIDFGGVTKMNKDGYCEINTDIVLTPEFIYGTKFYYTETTTREYDWYCVATTLLDSLGYFDSNATVPTYGIYKNKKIYGLTVRGKLFACIDKKNIETDVKKFLSEVFVERSDIIPILTKMLCHFYVEYDVGYNIIHICNTSRVTPSNEYRERLKKRYRSTLQQTHNKIDDFRKIVRIFLKLKNI